MSSSRRIVTNTLATYLKLAVYAAAGLFAVPVALKTLGAVDFGIYSVIGGCLSLLMFLNYSLQTGAERHIAHALGAGNAEEATEWFETSLMVHVTIGLVLTITAVTASDYILNHVLTIPAARLGAARYIYHMVVAAMVCNVIATPFQALVVAHEAIASISLMSACSGLVLIGALFSLKYLPGDALLWYSAIYSGFQASTAIGPVVYCYYSYPESRFRPFAFDRLKDRLRQLCTFSGWNLLHVLSVLVRVQGPAVVLNMFFGPIANAAYGLAAQAQNMASNVVWGFLSSAMPVIVKRHAVGDEFGMARLSNQSNTYGFAILWMFLGPILQEMQFCLRLWLHSPPPNTGAFLMPVLIALFVDQLTLGYNASLMATGFITVLSVVVSISNCMGVMAGYFFLRAGWPSSSILWAIVGAAVAAGCGRLWCARRDAALSLSHWVRDVMFPALVVTATSLAFSVGVHRILPTGFGRFAMVVTVNLVVVVVTTWFVGTNAAQRGRVKAFAALMFSSEPHQPDTPIMEGLTPRPEAMTAAHNVDDAYCRSANHR